MLQEKIHTGLPYSIELLDQIQEFGAIVDMANINFEQFTDEDPLITSFVYLRNTDFNNIELDFSKTTLDFKLRFLHEYLTGPFSIRNDLLDRSILDIFNIYISQKTNTPYKTEYTCSGFLDLDGIEVFILKYSSEILEALSLIKSLPLFLISRIKLQDGFNNDISEKTDHYPFKGNIINFLRSISEFSILLLKLNQIDDIPLKMYQNVFIHENEELFQELVKSDLGFLIHCVTNLSSDKNEA